MIIEDELPARAKLVDILTRLDPDTTVVAQLGSVKETLRWLSINEDPDIAFIDIQLSDDHSFEIFRKHPVSFPVIFTTAYDKYMLESFQYNSIDYLLKPITEERVKLSLEKIKTLQKHFLQGNIQNLINAERPNNRVVGKKGTDFIAFEVDDIAYFFTKHKIVFVRDFSGRQLILDKTLTEIEETIPGDSFFRVNRKFIAHYRAIEKFKSDHGKIKISLQPEIKEEVYVSKETAPAFREWIRGSGGG